MDDAQLPTLAALERPQVDGLAAEGHVCAVIGPHVAGEQLDQRRLARPVLADEGMHLSGADLERRVVERDLTGIGLGQRPDVEDGCRRFPRSASPSPTVAAAAAAVGRPVSASSASALPTGR